MIRRQTKQRESIYRAIVELGHADIHHIRDYLLTQNVNMPTATLYRNISVLLNEGLIRLVSSDDLEVYEATIHSPHHHFHCLSCDTIYDLTNDQIKICYDDQAFLEGFQITKENILLHGICPRCGKK